jgi:hypothetical protein
MVYSLRVPWVPLYRFPPLSLRAFAMHVAFPHSDSYAQSDCLQGLGDFGTGLPSLRSTVLHIPFRLSRVPIEGRKQDDLGGVLSFVPSALCGFPVVIWGRTGLPISPSMK